MVRKLAFGFAMLFGLVVASGWMPQTTTSMHMTADGPERMMWGLFAMSKLDDVTHGVTSLLLLVGALHSRKWATLAFTAFGWYYACDAVFYLIDGGLNHKPIGANIALNLPHVVLSTIMLSIAYWQSPREERREATARAVPAAA
ncbi:MAG TPA: DUF4383 domain-containing protein [Gemmatimonadaceae bacterium]|nr:DUF4383 domain-containing protein [Gemmatimonadaceae bacterium]